MNNINTKQIKPIHRLRSMVKDLSENITDEELNEIETKLPIDDYLNNEQYEYNGNFILSKNVKIRDQAVENMCCGIVIKDVKIKNNQTIYFAFDYGH